VVCVGWDSDPTWVVADASADAQQDAIPGMETQW
jgi:hypothetical protein